MSRNYDTSSSKVPNDDIAKHVAELIKKNSSDHEAYIKLRKQFGNDEKMINVIFDTFQESRKRVIEKAAKFKNLLYTHYRHTDLSFSAFVKKARKYKEKYSLTNEEFDLFYKLALSDTDINKTNYYNLPTSPMSKVLGFTQNFNVGEKLKLRGKEDNVHLENIKKADELNRELHKHVVLQSFTYNDCSEQAIQGKFRRGVQNPYSCVHPIVAAFFLPKIPFFEERIIYSSLSNLILQKNKTGMVTNKHDFDFYLDLVTDESALGYSMEPLQNLSYRVAAQIKMWDAIFNLRLGNYYNHDLAQFVEVLDECSNNFFDAADLSLVRDEGTILRRILSVFSLRPILVTVSPILISPTSPMDYPQMTTIPMITVRIRPKYLVPNTPNIVLGTVNLADALNTQQIYVDNKIIMKKNQMVIACRNVMIFHVPRRCHSYNLLMSTNFPSQLMANSLPATVSGIETINDTAINIPKIISLYRENYELKSSVLLEVCNINQNIIIGTSAYFSKRQEIVDNFYSYNPQSVAKSLSNDAIKQLHVNSNLADPNNEKFFRDISTRGTIIVYTQVPTKFIVQTPAHIQPPHIVTV